MDQETRTINGYPVIASMKLHDAGHGLRVGEVIVVRKPGEFVIAKHYGSDRDWACGNYIPFDTPANQLKGHPLYGKNEQTALREALLRMLHRAGILTSIEMEVL